jgi:hypothetical protein
VLKEPVQQEWFSYQVASRFSGLSHTTRPTAINRA